MLGNDIVDLEFCEPGGYQHVRYLRRVCAPAEAQAIRSSLDPVRALAVLWACKEAAYKAFSKDLPRPNFIPRDFVVQIGDRDPARTNENLSVLHAQRLTEVSIFATKEWVHAVATAPGMQERWKVGEIKNGERESGQADGESLAVRRLTVDLLNSLGFHDVRLQFSGRIPRLHRTLAGHVEMQVSLSHHGRFAAAAVAWPLNRARFRSPQDAVYAQTTNSGAPCSTCTA